jgi:2-polyprenyl-6-hydroxyphenyl methylase/3-demethylubiquinone-9 3-methyltransferase
VGEASRDAARVDDDEVDKFRRLADRWWDADGPMRPLHRLNPTRLAWLREQACRHFRRDPADRRPLQDLAALDVGCGGGLLAEPLARLGASVTGIDPAAENIAAATRHAAEVGLDVTYRTATTSEMLAEGRQLDLLTALEVVEHTPDPAPFVAELAELLAPGGMVVLSTLSRTWRAWLLGIVGAEYLLGWLAPGTHDWNRFITPAELARLLRQCGLRGVALTGLGYDVARDEFRTVRDTSVNYMLAAVRD